MENDCISRHAAIDTIVDKEATGDSEVKCLSCWHHIAERPFEVYCNIMCKWVNEKDYCTMFKPGQEEDEKNGGADMSRMNDLKPCPFCGSMPRCGTEFCESCGAEVKLAATVECTGCGVRKRVIFKASEPIGYVPFFDFDNAFNDVITKWNRRASDDESGGN